MIHNTKGIVLSRMKYSDTGIIATIFTEKFGLLSFLIYIGKSKVARAKNNLLQPLFLIDMQIYYKEKNSLQKVKTLSLDFPLANIPFDINKNGIAFFLAEFLSKTLKENFIEPQLFEYIRNTILILDTSEDSVANFHISFLIGLSKFLGIFPENTASGAASIFDISAGRFLVGQPPHGHFIPLPESNLLNIFLQTPITQISTILTTSDIRRNLLQKLIEYYYYHLEKPGQLKTLDILKQVMRG